MKFRGLFFLIFTLILTTQSACEKKSEVDSDSGSAKSHPGLILTREGVEEIRNSLGKYPLFDKSLRLIQMETSISV